MEIDCRSKNFQPKSRPATTSSQSLRTNSRKANPETQPSVPGNTGVMASKAASAEASTTPQTTFDTVGERVAAMRPSEELLDYYRIKVHELTADHESMLRRLDELGESCDQQHKLQWELKQRDEEIAELQRALSDMQMYLFQEREQVLRLYAENDRLKIRDLEDRKKIQHLLQLSGLTESEITYFVKEANFKMVTSVPTNTTTVPTANSTQSQSQPVSKQTNSQQNKKTVPALIHDAALRELESYRQQVKSLQSQLEEQTKLSREEIDALKEDRRIRTEEVEAQRRRDRENIQQLADKLKKTQELLYDSSKDFMEQRNQFRQAEKQWITEKDRLLRRLEHAKLPWHAAAQAAHVSGGMVTTMNNVPASLTTGISTSGNMSSRVWSEVNGQLVEKREEEMRRSIKHLEEQLEQQQKLAEMYRDQVVQLEDEFSRAREEGHVTKEVFKERSEKVTQRLQFMQQRYQELERRRALEVQGFQADIAQLRQKLRNIEKQLYKVTLDLNDQLNEKRPEDVDLLVLKNVRATALQSRKLSNELKNLKAMIYGLESELRRL